MTSSWEEEKEEGGKEGKWKGEERKRQTETDGYRLYAHMYI